MKYRIEIYAATELVKVYETDSFEEAQRIYHRMNVRWDCWTQLYVDGRTGTKAWMDRQMIAGDPRIVWLATKFGDF